MTRCPSLVSSLTTPLPTASLIQVRLPFRGRSRPAELAFDCLATGKVFTSVSEGTAKDVDKAVEVAQKAYETSWGLNVPGLERANILWKLAQLMEANSQELAALEALDNGEVIYRLIRRS